MAISTRNVRVFLNGEDISRMVRSMNIDADAGSAVTATLVLYPHVTWDADGNVHLDAGAHVGPLAEAPVAGMRVRGIQLVGDIPVGG